MTTGLQHSVQNVCLSPVHIKMSPTVPGASTTYTLIYMQPNMSAPYPSLTLFAFHRKCQTCSKINNSSASAGISFSKLLGLILLCKSRLYVLSHKQRVTSYFVDVLYEMKWNVTRIFKSGLREPSFGLKILKSLFPPFLLPSLDGGTFIYSCFLVIWCL